MLSSLSEFLMLLFLRCWQRCLHSAHPLFMSNTHAQRMGYTLWQILRHLRVADNPDFCLFWHLWTLDLDVPHNIVPLSLSLSWAGQQGSWGRRRRHSLFATAEADMGRDVLGDDGRRSLIDFIDRSDPPSTQLPLAPQQVCSQLYQECLGKRA